MKKLIRLLLSVVLLIVVIAAIAIGCLVMFVNPNQLKPVIANEVKNQTGYQLTLDGDLAWSFYPRIGVKIPHLSLSEPNQKPFIDLYQVTIASDLKDLLKGMQKLQGEVYVGSMQLLKLQITDAYVGLHWQNGLLTLEPLTASLYDGSLKGVVHGRNLSADTHWDWSMLATNVSLKPLLQDVNGASSKVVITGTGRVSMTAETHGKGKNQLFANVNGVSDFTLSNGTIEGMDINYLVRTADALLNHQAVLAPEHLEQTTFQRLTGTAAISNGVASINNLKLISSDFTTTGTGNIDLIAQQLNYQLQVTPLKTEKIRGTVPILVTGDLHNPTVRLDSDALKNMIAREQFEKVKSKVADEVKKLPEKANQLIQKLLQ